jgi:uncharacterized protein YneF (UPF0154 family)
MVNTIVIIIGLLISFLLGFFCATKSMQIGLRWKIQIEKKQEPVMDSIVKPVVTAIQQNKVNNVENYNEKLMREWMYGGEK